MSGPPAYRFRLNGVIIPEIQVRRASVHGRRIGEYRIVVRDPRLGTFEIDDNEGLPSAALSRFRLEFRDETAWAQLDPLEKLVDSHKGWRTVSAKKLLTILHEAGYVNLDA